MPDSSSTEYVMSPPYPLAHLLVSGPQELAEALRWQGRHGNVGERGHAPSGGLGTRANGMGGSRFGARAAYSVAPDRSAW